jgi:LysM repeat protein
LADERSSEEVILAYQSMSIEQLIPKLNSTQLVENGYTHRDLALGYLVSLRHFNLAKALEGTVPIPASRPLTTVVLNGKKQQISTFPGMADEQFEKIVEFARTEKWPLTSQGLFQLLQNDISKKQDPSLAEAFYLTSEFDHIETLFRRSGAEIERPLLLSILLEGSWDAFFAFSEQQKVLQDLSSARRQFFLMEYLLKGSKTAAIVLLKTDEQFVVRKLDDRSLSTILHLLNTPTPEAQSFALHLLSSPRSEGVRRLAAARLYEYAGESLPAAYSANDALAHFLHKHRQPHQKSVTRPPLAYQATKAPEQILIAQKEILPVGSEKQKPVSLPSPKPAAPRQEIVYYVVREGDSLWKISRQFKIEVDTLLKINHLSSDQLQPGMSLRIPIKKK